MTVRILILTTLLLSSAGCASYWQANRLEEKVDKLLDNTRRETLGEIFGDQAREISAKVETMSAEEQEKLDELVDSYQSGQQSIEEVRGSVLSVLGGTTRVVSSQKGIWVRDTAGDKTRAISRDTKLKGCQRVEEAELPQRIMDSRALSRFSWGRGELDGQEVLFPWELTMSQFTKEIVENTARRTAQEFLRMSGDKGWSRPVHIKVITETPGESVTIQHPGVEEIYVEPAPPDEAME